MCDLESLKTQRDPQWVTAKNADLILFGASVAHRPARRTMVQFRYLAVTPKGGQGNWSQPLALLVK